VPKRLNFTADIPRAWV